MGLFDKEYEFRGKHANYCRFLKDEGIITTFREIYLISTVVGFLNGVKAPIDKEENSAPASIMASELIQQKENLTFLYRIIMLTEETDGFSIDDYKDRAFRYDSSDEYIEQFKNNMELFNSYSRGGIELLYEMFKDNSESKKEKAKILYNFLNDFASDNGFAIMEEDDDF